MDFKEFNRIVLQNDLPGVQEAMNRVPKRGRRAFLMSACCVAFRHHRSIEVVSFLAERAGLFFHVDASGIWYLRA
jgi:hypothetical protein